jgi:ferredoxin-type protein NapH
MNAPELPAVARPVRHYQPPSTLAGRLWALRYTLARRALQFGLLLAFFGTAHWGWTVFGQPLLAGNLSASSLAGTVPLADPFAVLQMLVARHWLASEVLIGAALLLGLYALVGGRSFCGWVCPMNFVTDAADWLRDKTGVQADVLRMRGGVRYAVLALALALSAATGLAAFEWVSPQAMVWRELVFGLGLGLTAAAGVFAFDFAILRRGWCGHVCPLGAFWALVGKTGQVKVRYDAASCTRCGDCVKVCPEPQVLNFKLASERGLVASGECINCGRCIVVCPEDSLAFGLRVGARRPPTAQGDPR